jgi:hypothetical protein
LPARSTRIGSVERPEEEQLRKKLISITGAIGLAAVLVSTAVAAKTKSFHFTTTITGAQISATQAVYKVHDSRMGNGAGVQTVTINGTTGTDKEITYYGNASATSKGTFTLGAPDANGILKVSGKGHDVSGTGKLKGFTSTYTYSGTFNTKTLVYTIVLKGTGSTK